MAACVEGSESTYLPWANNSARCPCACHIFITSAITCAHPGRGMRENPRLTPAQRSGVDEPHSSRTSILPDRCQWPKSRGRLADRSSGRSGWLQILRRMPTARKGCISPLSTSRTSRLRRKSLYVSRCGGASRQNNTCSVLVGRFTFTSRFRRRSRYLQHTATHTAHTQHTRPAYNLFSTARNHTNARTG